MVDRIKINYVQYGSIANALCSGGGYRATVGSAGFVKAMKERGVLDCVMQMQVWFVAGKSTYHSCIFEGVFGSCWTFLLYYSSLIATNTNTLLDRLKNRLQVKSC